MTAERTQQLALRFPVPTRNTLQNYEAGPNGELIERLRRALQSDAFAALWIVGAAGAGKSHLLQGACQAAHARGATAAYVSSGVIAGGAAALEGLDEFDLVAIDDVERWLGERAREEALLGIYVGLTRRGGTFVAASKRAPGEIAFVLADLASRLRGAEVFAIGELDDSDRAQVIARLASQRGLALAADVVTYVLRRAPRGMAELVAAFDRLDRAAWAQQRRVTIPLVKDVLGL